jgi:sec-independent protein translocase protein TatC
MIRRDYDDEDLFKDSTMTFGEHLEELRYRLFRAITGLAIGFTLGLLIGNQVVLFIEMPLTNALTEYYSKKALTRAEGKLAKLKEEGKSLPADQTMLKQMVEKWGLLPEEIFIQPDELIGPLKDRYPQQLSGFTVPQRGTTQGDNGSDAPAEKRELTKDDMLRVFVWRPVVDDDRVRIKTLNAQEAFMIYVKASLLAGAIFSSPWVFFQLWAFVAAGLYPHEKRYVHYYLPFSVFLFLGGAALAFFFVFEPVLRWLFSFNAWMGMEPDPRISEWLGLVLAMPIGFGLSFQLPLVMLFLERIGVFTVESYVASWRISVLAIFVIAMILTPADPYSMFLMAIPLLFLYVFGILLCKYLPRNRSPYDEEDEEWQRRRGRASAKKKKEPEQAGPSSEREKTE